MTDRYAACGKEVLCDGEHFADCAAQEDATRVAALLNLADETLRAPPVLGLAEQHYHRLRGLGEP